MHKISLVFSLFLVVYGSYAQPSSNYGGEIHYQSHKEIDVIPAYSDRVINDSITISYNDQSYPYTYRFSLKSGEWVSLGQDSIKKKKGFDQFAEVPGNNLVGFDGVKLYTYDNQMVNVLDSIVPTFQEIYGCASGFFGFSSGPISNMRHSTDGLTWSTSSFPANFGGNSQKLEDHNGDRILISHNGSYVYSLDGGATFNSFNNYPSNFTSLLIRFTGQNGIFILSDSCYFSPNMGLTWQSSPPLSNYAEVVHLRGDSLLLIHSNFSAMNKLSTDGGISWNNWFSTTQGSPEVNAFVYDDSLYVVDLWHHIKKMTANGGLEYFTHPSFSWSCSGDISGISVQGNRVMLIKDRDCVGLSEDNGYNFSSNSTSNPLTWADFSPNGRILALGSFGGIYFSKNGKLFTRSGGLISNTSEKRLSFDSTGSKVIFSNWYSNDSGSTFNYTSIHDRFNTSCTPGGQIFGCDLWSGPFIGNDDKLVINKFDTNGTTFPVDTFEFPGSDLSWERMVMIGENIGWIFLSDRVANEIKVIFSKDGWRSISFISTISYTSYLAKQIKWLEVYSPNEIFLSIGENHETYYSSDTGKTFYPITGLPSLITVNNISSTAVNFGDTNSWFLANYDMLIMNNVKAWPVKKPVDLSLKYNTNFYDGEIYPNPANSRVFFPKEARGLVKIYSINGLVCDEMEIINSSIQIQSLEKGLHFLHYKVKDEFRVSKLMVQ